LTPKQLELLAFIKKYKADNQDSPTMRQMAAAMGITIGTVQSHMRGLIKAGAIKHVKGQSKYAVVK
jgi:DNA-binding MarR family transcriptional regulator